MEETIKFYLTLLVTFLSSVLASTGLWKWISDRRDKNDARNAMLRGLAHDRIMYLGMSYIKRGSVTPDEFENLNDYLFVPYQALGGNGSAARIMDEVKKLPIVPNKQG